MGRRDEGLALRADYQYFGVNGGGFGVDGEWG